MNKFANLKNNNSEDEEGDDLIMQAPQNIHLPFFRSTHSVQRIKAYLDEQIREPKYYRQLIQAIDTMGEYDTLELHIDTYGGSLDGAVALINAMDGCEGKVCAIVNGVAASAGSLIALSAPNVFVGPYATMMIHAASFGSFGKQSDVIGHAAYVDKRVKTLMGNIYKDFLTPEELAEVFMGREIWLMNDELIERLKKRSEIQAQRMQEVERSMIEAEEKAEQKPKRVRKAKT